MDPITITVSVISAVAGILTTYKTGRGFYKKWQAKKKAKKPAEAEVEDSLEVGPEQIDSHCTQLSRRHGRAFEQGDNDSRESLLRISLDLNQSLVDVLRGSLLSGQPDSIEPQQLWTASEQAQKQTIRAMIDLAQRIQVAAPIPRPLRQTRGVSGASDASNLQMVLHPARATLTPSDAVIPSLAIEASPFSSSSDSESVLSLQLTPISRRSSVLSSISTTSSFQTPYPSPLQSTPLLLPPIFPNTDGKTTSDLLREWKEDLNARSPPLLSPNSPATTTSFPSPRGKIKRYSSAPSTPSLNLASPRPNRMSVRSPQLPPSLSGPGLGLGIQNSCGNRMSSQRVQSDSYVQSSLASNTQGDIFPTTSLHKGFTHSLQNSAGSLGNNRNGGSSRVNG